MIKTEIISLIRSLIPREDATNRFHERVLEANIEKVIIEMYQDLFKINPRLLSQYTKQYGETTPIAILTDNNTGIYYSLLPAKIVSLNSKSSGVLHIFPVVNTGNVFQPMDSTEADLLFNTDVAVVSNRIGYKVRQDTRVDYWNMNSEILETGVRMSLLVPFSVYEDDDVVMIPELGEKEGGSFVNRVLTVLQVIPPADLKDDNASHGYKQKQSKSKE